MTTPKKSGDALRAALAIKKLLAKSPIAQAGEENRVARAVAAFKRFDFKTSLNIAEGGM